MIETVQEDFPGNTLSISTKLAMQDKVNILGHVDHANNGKLE